MQRTGVNTGQTFHFLRKQFLSLKIDSDCKTPVKHSSQPLREERSLFLQIGITEGQNTGNAKYKGNCKWNQYVSYKHSFFQEENMCSEKTALANINEDTF